MLPLSTKPWELHEAAGDVQGADQAYQQARSQLEQLRSHLRSDELKIAFLKDKLAICERPGGYGENHRRVRRQEEIIWLRENGFGCVVSIIPAPHNLHNYDELGVTSRHRPFTGEDLEPWLRSFYRELNDLLKAGTKVVVHGEEVGDRLVGIMGGYIRWAGLVDDDTKAITITERLAGRQLDPFARNVILIAPSLR